MKQTNVLQSDRRGRHYGIDLLRFISMFMVLVLHILGYGGVLGGLEPGDSNYIAAWFLKGCACCAVNCYALISGYVGVDARYKYSNLVLLWLQVVLYMLLGNLAFAVLDPGSVTLKTVIKGFFPFLQNHYWYFTAYCCLFLFIPLLNKLINSLNRKQAAVVCTLIFLIFFVVLTAARSDEVFQVGGGYSVHWLAMLYVIGGCIKKHGFLQNCRMDLLLLGYFLCVAIAVGANLFISTTSISVISGNISNEILLSYTAPTVFLCGVFLLVLCSKHPHLPGWVEKALSVLAPVSFGVYIIHAQPLVYNFFFNGTFRAYRPYSALGVIGATLLTAAIVYGACAVIDTLRIRLFQALRLRQRLQRLEEKYVGDFWKQEQTSEELKK